MANCVEKSKAGGALSCNICGVAAGCDSGGSCYWGGLKASLGDSSGFENAVARGFEMYCMSSGGTMVASASPAGVQGRSIDTALRSLSRAKNVQSIGGAADYGRVSFGEGSASQSFGLAFPISKTFQAGANQDFIMSGTLLGGRSSLDSGDKTTSAMQFGVNARPMYLTMSRREGDGARGVLGVGVPVQVVVNTGTGLDAAVGYFGGAGVLAGVTSSGGRVGLGLTVDGMYVQGLQIPAMVALRFVLVEGTTTVVLQPAATADIGATSRILDSLQEVALLGFDMGDWLVGLQAFVRGTDGFSAGFGISNNTRAGKLAAGRGPSLAARSEGDRKGQTGERRSSHDRCRKTLDCREGERCYDGECLLSEPSGEEASGRRGAKAKACKRTLDCPDGEVCLDRQCVNADPAKREKQRSPEPEPEPAAPAPEDRGAVVIAEVPDDVTAGARLRASLGDVLRNNGFEPKLRKDVEAALEKVAPSVESSKLDDDQLESVRDEMKAGLLVHVAVTAAEGGKAHLKVRLRRSARWRLVERDVPEGRVIDESAEMLKSLLEGGK